jgi:hypothetical protein
MKLKVFGKKTCSVCKDIYEKLERYNRDHTPIPLEYVDAEEIDGLTELCFLGGGDIPVVFLLNDKGAVIKKWQQSCPTFQELTKLQQ